MERLPNPEKPLKDKCNACGKKYKLTEETAVAITYTKQPDCRHLVTCCPHCSQQTRIFVPPTSNSLERAEQTGVPVHYFEYASDEIYDMFLRVYDIELIEPKELTPRQEDRVRFGTYLLDRIDTVEDFLNETN